MKLVLFLIFLFLILSVLYGIASGVQAVGRAAGRLSPRKHRDISCAMTESPDAGAGPEPLSHAADAPAESRHCIEELKSLFALHQCGALTRHEFDRLKRHLLAAIPS